MSVVGFDLGNESSCVGVARRRGIDVLQNEVGNRKTATCVSFNGKQRLVGDAAVSLAMSNAKNTVQNIKRLLGRSFDEPELKLEQPYLSVKLAKSKQGLINIQVNYDDQQQEFTPEQIAGAIFAKLKVVAEKGLEGQRVVDCVIGVPSDWNDVQRRAVLDAANIAGLNVLRLMNETTAVALNYGILRQLSSDAPIKVIFYDMGQTSTHVSLVELKAGKLTVLATAADRNLGGREFDQMLVKHFAKYIKEKYKMDVLSEPKATLKLQKECTRVKKILSANSKVPFNVEYIMNDRDVSGVIDRPEFEALAADNLVSRVVAPVKRVLEIAGVKKEEVQDIEIVGGAVRIPVVQKALQDYYGKEMSKTCDGDESVARGCTLMCAMLSPSFKVREFEVHDISPYAIDLHWGPIDADPNGPLESSTPLFTERNALPSIKMVAFKDRTEPFQIVARYPDAALAQMMPGTKAVIGRWVISGMPATKDQPPRIKVRVKLNLHGVVEVSSAQVLEEIDEPDAGVAGAASPPGAKDETEDASMEDDEKDKKEKGKTESMDTSEDKTKDDKAKADEAKQPAKKKKKVKRVELKVAPTLGGGMDSQTVQLCVEKEVQMNNQDKAIAETAEARNQLESYVLEMRNKLSGELKPYIKEADAAKFEDALGKVEDWLYNDGSDAQKSDYKKKLADLKVFGDPVASRRYEDLHRNEAVASLKKVVVQFQMLSQSTEEKYSHIEAEERKKVLAEATSADQFLGESLGKQDKLSKFDNPVVSCEQLRQRQVQVENVCGTIMNKPKPPPPKKEEPKPEAKPEPKADKPEDAKKSDDKSDKKDKMEDEKPKDEKPKDEKPKDEKPKDEKPKEEKPKDEPKPTKKGKEGKGKKDAKSPNQMDTNP